MSAQTLALIFVRAGIVLIMYVAVYGWMLQP